MDYIAVDIESNIRLHDVPKAKKLQAKMKISELQKKKSDDWPRRFCPSTPFVPLCLCLYPHATTRLPIDGFSQNLVFESHFEKSVDKIHLSFKSGENIWYFT